MLISVIFFMCLVSGDERKNFLLSYKELQIVSLGKSQSIADYTEHMSWQRCLIRYVSIQFQLMYHQTSWIQLEQF